METLPPTVPNWREQRLAQHIETYGWPAPARQDVLAVFSAPDGVRECAWFREARDDAELTAALHNKSEALARKFYGIALENKNAQGGAAEGREAVTVAGPVARKSIRTSFMANGYVVLVHYVAYCQERGLPLAMDAAAKAKAFLEARLETARADWHKRAAEGHKGNSTSPADAAYNAYRHSVCHLSALSFWQGYGIDLVLTEEIQTLRIALLQDIKRAKVGVQDSAATSALLTKRLDTDETARLFRALWEGNLEGTYKTAGGRDRAQMRGLLVAALNQAVGRRGGDIRGMDLRMFLWHALEDVGPAPAWCIGVSLRTVKEDNLLEDKEHLIGFIRARERWRCPVGVLAAYLQWLNETTGFLAVMRKDLARPAGATPAWWSLPLLPGRKAGTSISSTTHTTLTHAGFDAGEIYGKRAITHIHRPTTLGNMLEGGVVSTDAALYQGWVHGVWADTYSKASFKVLPMLKAHGWAPRIDGYECWWEGSDADIPPELLAAVFPGLDELAAGAAARWRERRDDRSMLEFCKVLKALRRVFIEDARVHREAHPDFPAYRQCALFSGATGVAWTAWAAAESGRIDARRAAHELRRLDAGLASALTSMVADLKASLAPAAVQTAQATTQPAAVVASPAAPHPPLAPTTLPELPEPHLSSLAITYERWRDGPREAYRAFLAENKCIQWTKIFPRERASAIKVRYHKMRPFLYYLDAHENDAPRLLAEMTALVKKYKVTGNVFIKHCFYSYATAAPDTPWTAPIPREEMEAVIGAL